MILIGTEIAFGREVEPRLVFRVSIQVMKLNKEQCFRQQNLFGGQGQVLVWDLLKGESAGQIKSVLGCTLEAGGSVGSHRQADTDEVMIIHSGQGTASVGETEYTLQAGTVIHLPLGQYLKLENSSGDEELHYYIIKSAP